MRTRLELCIIFFSFFSPSFSFLCSRLSSSLDPSLLEHFERISVCSKGEEEVAVGDLIDISLETGT